MTILITGSTGLLGQALISHLARSAEVTGLSRSDGPASGARRHVACDLRDAERTVEAIGRLRPELVINAQALSDVDRCEREPAEAHAQNVMATEHLIRAVEPIGARLVHVSTDYVFDGRKGAPYDEGDTPNPISVYGRSKLEAERLVLGCARAVVARTSTLFGPGRMNFCDHLVSRLRAGETVEAFTDQVTSPTYSVDLAEGLAEVGQALGRNEDPGRPRLYHIANAGGCSRVALAERVADLLGCPRDLIRRIPVAAQKRPAPRPAYTALTTTNLPLVIGRTLRPWDDALQDYLRQRRWLN